VTNWSVHSASARALTSDLFRRRSADPGLSRSEALRRSMVALIDGPVFVDAAGRSDYAYAHPLFWAPFTVIGAAGGFDQRRIGENADHETTAHIVWNAAETKRHLQADRFASAVGSRRRLGAGAAPGRASVRARCAGRSGFARRGSALARHARQSVATAQHSRRLSSPPQPDWCIRRSI